MCVNVTNYRLTICVFMRTSLETAIVEFITMIEDGPDMDLFLDSTVGFSIMEMSDVYVDMEYPCYEWEYWNPDQVDENQPYNGCPDVVEVSIHYMGGNPDDDSMFGLQG